MPKMTGFELHEHLIEAGYAIPTILVTAYPDDVDRTRALNDGVVCYFVSRLMSGISYDVFVRSPVRRAERREFVSSLPAPDKENRSTAPPDAFKSAHSRPP